MAESAEEPRVEGGAPVRLLVADDEPAILEMIRRGARGLEGMGLTMAHNGDEALRLLVDEDAFDMVLTDVRMPGSSGMDVLKRVRELSADIPVILMSAVATVEEVLQLQQAGATLFLRKPFGVPELQLLLRHGCRMARQLRTARHLHRIAPHSDVKLPGLVGRSPAFLRALVHLSSLSRTDAPLMIGGETGTGKELVARAAHQLSARKDKPFVAVNCSALTDSLMDSELFGHVRGSFTGALRDNPGLFRAAEGGTLFLDEIGDLAPAGQAKLLRVLQEHEVRAVGSTRPVHVNVRVMAATHRDLASLAQRGDFRQDLYYRLRVGEVRLPPLRERVEDILPLAHAFLEKFRRESGVGARAFDPAAVQALTIHGWPGNVRELEATVTRAAAVAQSGIITVEDLDLMGSGDTPRPVALDTRSEDEPLMKFADAKQQVLEAFERSYLTRLLARHPAVTVAAHRAGIDRKSLYRLLKKHGMSHNGAEEPDAEELQTAS